MSLNSTPISNRKHIVFLGSRNAGKSSLINAISNQEISITSDIPGTTTDPVRKTMEILPLGPVVLIDTPGLDDEGELGAKRVEKTKKEIERADIAIVVIDSTIGMQETDKIIATRLKTNNIPFLLVFSKHDLINQDTDFIIKSIPKELKSENHLFVSSKTAYGIEELKNKLALFNDSKESEPIVSDLVRVKDTVLLVIPIDSSAPKGRLILPQQMVIRDLLDNHVNVISVQVEEIKDIFNNLKEPPSLVITDSQKFKEVSKIVPENIRLTSFSILMARYKGILKNALEGADVLDVLKDNDKILISEGCTHHRQCEDIGTVKLPNWIKKYSKKSIEFEFTSGGEFKEDLSKYRLVIHCGGCMLNDKEIISRFNKSEKQDIPITNYGMAIAKMNGILDRSVSFL